MSFLKNLFILIIIGSLTSAFVVLSRKNVPLTTDVVKSYSYSDFVKEENSLD